MFQTTNQLVSHSQCWLYLRLFPFVGPTCLRLVGWHVAAESPSRPSGRWAGPFRNGAGLGTLEKCQCLVLISWADHRKTIGKWRFTSLPEDQWEIFRILQRAGTFVAYFWPYFVGIFPCIGFRFLT